MARQVVHDVEGGQRIQEASRGLLLELMSDVVGELLSSVSVVVAYHREILVGFQIPQHRIGSCFAAVLRESEVL